MGVIAASGRNDTIFVAAMVTEAGGSAEGGEKQGRGFGIILWPSRARYGGTCNRLKSLQKRVVVAVWMAN